MAKKIKDYLPFIIPAAHGWKTRLLKHWHEIIGSLSEHLSLQRINEQQLHIGVSHPVWAQECQELVPMLRGKINTFLQEDRIKDIRFVLTGKHERPTSPSSLIRPTKKINNAATLLLTNSEQDALDVIKDLELRTELMHFLTRCHHVRKRSEYSKDSLSLTVAPEYLSRVIRRKT